MRSYTGMRRSHNWFLFRYSTIAEADRKVVFNTWAFSQSFLKMHNRYLDLFSLGFCQLLCLHSAAGMQLNAFIWKCFSQVECFFILTGALLIIGTTWCRADVEVLHFILCQQHQIQPSKMKKALHSMSLLNTEELRNPGIEAARMVGKWESRLSMSFMG